MNHRMKRYYWFFTRKHATRRSLSSGPSMNMCSWTRFRSKVRASPAPKTLSHTPFHPKKKAPKNSQQQSNPIIQESLITIIWIFVQHRHFLIDGFWMNMMRYRFLHINRFGRLFHLDELRNHLHPGFVDHLMVGHPWWGKPQTGRFLVGETPCVISYIKLLHFSGGGSWPLVAKKKSSLPKIGSTRLQNKKKGEIDRKWPYHVFSPSWFGSDSTLKKNKNNWDVFFFLEKKWCLGKFHLFPSPHLLWQLHRDDFRSAGHFVRNILVDNFHLVRQA